MPGDPIRPLTLALCQFAPRKGDVRANLRRLGRLAADAAVLEPRPQVVVFPETATSGYFVEGAVREVALTAGSLATELDEAYRAACADAGRDATSIDVVVGFYERWRDTLHNSAAYLSLGLPDGPPVVRHVHRKNYLPTYGLFDEERFVERGTDLAAFETPWGRAALLVCEDAWHSLSGTIAALDGAQVVFCVSATPARGPAGRTDGRPGPANTERWERLLRGLAEEQGVFAAYANLVGTEGGKRFPGGAFVVGPEGDVRASAPLWDAHLALVTLDLDDLVHARADSPLLADLRVALPHVLEQLRRVREHDPAPLAYDGVEPQAFDLVREARGFETGEFAVPADLAGAAGTAPAAEADAAADEDAEHDDAADARTPSIAVSRHRLRDHGGPPPLTLDLGLTEHWLTGFVREEFAHRGFTRAVVGLSGGVDSALTAFLAARALGPEHVLAVRMPYRTSSPESLAHAQLVIDTLGLPSRTIDISDAVDGYLAHEPDADPTRRGNVMARQRMIVLFDLAAGTGALPIGTGNKTERLFGYYTWHADDSPPVNPVGDLYKSQVWALARHVGVPDVIVDKPATADLVVGQTDESDLGITYPRADELLNWILHGWSAEALLARGFDPRDVQLVTRKLGATHWKRRPPSTAMISSSAIGESYLRPVDY